MGEVYRAKDQKLGREVAVKVLPDVFGRDPARVARFEREARAAAALSHPNICAIHEIGEHEGQPFIVMELIKGQTLEARLSKEGRLEYDAVLELGIQLADALDAAHGAGIVHRDMKPANIFITDRGQAKILDFGLAKTGELSDQEAPTAAHDAGLTAHGAVLGTVAYMSPEQALGKQLDARTDLFSLGLVIYEALTGKRAFTGDTSAAIFDQILNRPPTPLAQLNPKVSPELRRRRRQAAGKGRRSPLSARLRAARRPEADAARHPLRPAAAPAGRARSRMECPEARWRGCLRGPRTRGRGLGREKLPRAGRDPRAHRH